MKPLPGISPPRGAFTRTASIHLSPIKEMELRAARLPGVVSLAQGIPSFDTPEPIRRYVQEKLEGGECSRYSLTPGLPKLREAIAETLLADGMRYDPVEEIIVSCGSIEAIAATLLAALEPGDEVLLASPSYASYGEVVRVAGGMPRWIPLIEEDNFALDLDALERGISRRTRAILLANPSNPTGTVFPRSQIEHLGALAERHGLLIVTDEVYKDFLYIEEELFTPARIEGLRRNVVRVFSFSKAYGMTGWRVGFLHSDRANVAEILKVHDSLVTCAPVVSQYAALKALELGDEPIARFRTEFRKRRDRMLARLDALSLFFDYQKPSASYFVFPRVKDTVPLARDSRRLASDLLERALVAVVPGVAFGPTGEAHLRLSYGRPGEDIDEAFSRIEGYFRAQTRRFSRPAAAGRGSDAPAGRSEPRAGTRDRARSAAVAALDWLARRYLGRVRPKVVALAGLQGKTVMKRSLREMFEGSLRVRANPRSYNTDVGLPLAILATTLDGSRPAAAARALVRAARRGLFAAEPLDLLILEMGLRRPGDAAQCLHAVVPDVLVLTPLAPSFSNDLPFLETVEAEVATLAAAVHRAGGAVVVCRDDPRLLGAVNEIAGVITFGRDQLEREGGAPHLRLRGERIPLGLDVVGDSAAYALMAGGELAAILGIPTAAVRAYLERGTRRPAPAH